MKKNISKGISHGRVAENRRAQYLLAYRQEGKTKYKPILGKAKDIL